MHTRHTRRGFTLIELLVVVIIIAILAAIALPQYNKAVMKARLADVETFIAHVEKAMDLYVLENGYPSSYKDIPWDEMGIDVSSYCDSIGTSSEQYECTAKNFKAHVRVFPTRWDLALTPSSTAFGPSYIYIQKFNNGTESKTCSISAEDISSLRAKPMCDALKANDSSWNISLPC